LASSSTPEFGHRGGSGPVVTTIHGDPAGGRSVESGNHPHGGRFPGTVRAQEPGDDSRLDDETQSVDGEFVAVLFAEILDFDHGGCLSKMFWDRRTTVQRAARTLLRY